MDEMNVHQEQLKSRMNEQEESFLKFYMEQTWEEMRHIEGMRERVAIAVVTLALAITAFILQKEYVGMGPFAIAVILIGGFGLLFTMKMYQLHSMDQKRLNKWYSTLLKI